MFSATGDTIGIRLRTIDGKKFAVKGSRQGLFIPEMVPRKELVVTEGPTDTAAALSLDLFAIGKPSCLGCENMVNELVALHRIRTVVVVADRDAPGQRGAERLQATLSVPSVIFTPPAKDFRAAVNAGMTKEIAVAMIKNQVWTKPK
jgi:5S rRNA maturation endonuclease (ribonuclease M5)